MAVSSTYRATCDISHIQPCNVPTQSPAMAAREVPVQVLAKSPAPNSVDWCYYTLDSTAEVAVRASLTGHLLLSTVHTNDAPSAVLRLVNLGVDPYLLAASTIGVIAQRLVRLVCPGCRVPAAVPAALLAEFPRLRPAV